MPLPTAEELPVTALALGPGCMSAETDLTSEVRSGTIIVLLRQKAIRKKYSKHSGRNTPQWDICKCVPDQRQSLGRSKAGVS